MVAAQHKRCPINDQTHRVLAIPYKEAKAAILANHYLHRMGSCSWAYGLYDEGRLAGVVTFGSPVSSTLCRGVCGPDEAPNLTELTRLWIEDGQPWGTASWFVARAMRQVPKSVIVAFADPSVGHHGGVYQALNFVYTGLGPPRKRWFDPAHPNAHTHRSATSRAANQTLRDEGRLLYIPAVQKHRYVFFQGRRKRTLREKLRYPVLAYPKPDLITVQSA